MSGASKDVLFDRYANKLSKTPSRPAYIQSPVKHPHHSSSSSSSSSRSSPSHHPPQHTRSASSSTSTLPFITNLFSPGSSSFSSSPSSSASHTPHTPSSPSTPSMKHTRTLVRSERPRPRATGVRWHELTSRFDPGKVDAAVQAEDLQWRQRVIRENLTEDLKAIEAHLLLLLDRPQHPLHAFCHQFIAAFNTHYTPLLSLSSKLSADLLYYAVTELDHFSACLAALIMAMFPEVYSRDIQEAAKLTVFEYVCPSVYAVLFAIYRRKNYYKDGEFGAKLVSLQGVSIGELGVAEALRLDGSEEGGVGAGEGGEGRGERVTQTPRQLSSLAPPLIATSPSSPASQSASAPPSPAPASPAPPSPNLTSPPSASPSAEQPPKSPQRQRRGITRLKTMTSFDPDALKGGERAKEIVEQLSILNSTAELAEVDEGEEARETNGEGPATDDHAEDDVDPVSNPTSPPAPSTPRMSSLSVALKQLMTSDASPVHSEASSPALTATNHQRTDSTPISSLSSLSPARAPTITSSLTPATPHYPYHEAVLLFRRLTSSRTPRAKLSVFQLLSSQICLCVDDYYKRTGVPRPPASQLSINADDLLSILSYILIKARLPYLVSEVAFIEDFVTDGLRISQLGYFLAVFQASIELIQNLKGGGNDGGLKRNDVAEEDERAGEGKSAMSLPSPSPSPLSSGLVGTATASSLPDQHSVSSALSHSVSSPALGTSPASASGTSEGSGSVQASPEEGDGSAVLHMDMASLLSDTSQVNNYHFAVPTPEEEGRDGRITNGNGDAAHAIAQSDANTERSQSPGATNPAPVDKQPPKPKKRSVLNWRRA